MLVEPTNHLDLESCEWLEGYLQKLPCAVVIVSHDRQFLDKVVQQNAANAEESASASEEMNAQAEQMNANVGDLMDLVGGSKKGKAAQAATSQVEAAPKKAGRRTAKALAAPVKKREDASPEELIPMGDEDLKDF